MSTLNLDLASTNFNDPIFDSYAPGTLKIPLYLCLVTGNYYNLLNPDPKLITPEVIAIGVARMNRYGNQSKVKITVGQHSIAAAKHLLKNCPKKTLKQEPWLPLGALLHDGSEALLLDIPTQIKQLLPHYQMLESRTMNAVATAFSLPEGFHHHPEIVKADRDSLSDEIQNVHGIDPLSWGKTPAKHNITRAVMNQTKTEKSCVRLFIREFQKYEARIKRTP